MAQQSDLHVLTECYIDTKLIKTLVPPRGNYNHQKGTFVLKTMDEKLHDEFALGIVDEDMKDRRYAEQFKVVYTLPDTLQLLKHPDRYHFLIYICPVIETWMLIAAEAMSVSLSQYGLPHDVDKLRKLTKTSKSENNDPYSESFKQLFSALKIQKPVCIAVLSFWVKYLREERYKADLTYLIQETDRLCS